MEGALIAWAQGVACSNHAAPTKARSNLKLSDCPPNARLAG